MSKVTWQPLGSVTIDTARMILVDPMHTNLDGAADDSQVEIGNGTSAVIVHTGMGDGRYRVEGRYVDCQFGRRLAEIRVRFLDKDGNWLGGD